MNKTIPSESFHSSGGFMCDKIFVRGSFFSFLQKRNKKLFRLTLVWGRRFMFCKVGCSYYCTRMNYTPKRFNCGTSTSSWPDFVVFLFVDKLLESFCILFIKSCERLITLLGSPAIFATCIP